MFFLHKVMDCAAYSSILQFKMCPFKPNVLYIFIIYYLYIYL